jgi:hypothetical protein
MIFSRDPQVAEQQMLAIIVYCTTFGYIDGDFDLREKEFIRRYIQGLIETRIEESGVTDHAVAMDLLQRWKAHYDRVFEDVDAGIRRLFDEVVEQGENMNGWIYARLKLQCFEWFKRFDPENQRRLLAVSNGLIAADGKVHPGEEKFRQELLALLEQGTPPLAAGAGRGQAQALEVGPQVAFRPAVDDHAMLQQLEIHYSRDPRRLAQQIEIDSDLMRRTVGIWDDQRGRGRGRLSGKKNVAELAGTGDWLDGYTYGLMPRADEELEITVLGDLHGCYSCLKGALLQVDFFRKVESHRRDPRSTPRPEVVLLGDYVDRGFYSMNGILRAVMQLFVSYPENVYVLRGNHEYFVRHQGQVQAGVRPAEAIATLAPHVPAQVLEMYMTLFENMPTVLLFDRTIMVHAGIPRDEILAQRWRDLSSLNDSDMRFQMMWSDPSTAAYIPADLQRENARFPFGSQQFRAFMQRLGATTMIRGHEKVDEGYKKIYDEPDLSLVNLFSAGGKDNWDLPPESSYRKVTPMALNISWKNGQARSRPFAIDWQSYQDPRRNGFLRAPAELEFRYQ